AHPVLMDAAQHDRQLALTSHLPQAVASLLAHLLARAVPPGASVGPGARDVTRLAASEPALWTEILLMNRDEVLPALRALEEPLGSSSARSRRAMRAASPPGSPAGPRGGGGSSGEGGGHRAAARRQEHLAPG